MEDTEQRVEPDGGWWRRGEGAVCWGARRRRRRRCFGAPRGDEGPWVRSEDSKRGGGRGGAVGGYGSRPVVGGSSHGAGAADGGWRGPVAAPANDATAHGIVGGPGDRAAGGSGSGATRGLGGGAVRGLGGGAFRGLGGGAEREMGRGADGLGYRGAVRDSGRGAGEGGWRGTACVGGPDATAAMACGAAGSSRRGGTGSVAGRKRLNRGAGMGGEIRLGGDRSPGRGMRTEHEGNEDFDEDWSQREQRAWIMRRRARFDKSRLTAP